MSTTGTPPIVQQIIEQIGQGTFYMLGSRGTLSYADEKTLHFRVKGSPKSVNHIAVSLNSNDTYKMIFGRVHGGKYRVINAIDEFYVDSLHELIEENTYLRTQVPTIVFK